MSTQSDYLTGWINTSIHEFLEEIEEPASSMKFALVTYLDSSPDVASIFGRSKPFASLKDGFRAIGAGALLPTRQLLAAQRRQRIFFGFDEVWFFPEADIAPKPEDLVITAPHAFGPPEVDRFGAWLASNRCSLGLGDGVGMSYCLRIRGAARFIVQAMNESRAHPRDDERGIA